MTNQSWVSAAAFAATLSMAGGAFAQESNFEGFYVGGQVGYSNITEEISVVGITFIDETADGFGGGGFIGFGGTNGSLYGSIEAEVGYDGADWSISGSSGATSLTVDVEAQLTYGLGFRIGGIVADNVLLYGRLGWVRTNFETTFSVVDPEFTGSVSVENDLDGFRFGGGVEGMLADNIGVRAEYTYTIYDVDDFVVGGITFEDDVDQHLFRVGIAYYF